MGASPSELRSQRVQNYHCSWAQEPHRCDGGFSKWAQITEGSEFSRPLCAGTARMCVMGDSQSGFKTITFRNVTATVCRNRTDVCDGGFSKWAQITEGAVKEMEQEFGGLPPRLPMREYSKCVCVLPLPACQRREFRYGKVSSMQHVQL